MEPTTTATATGPSTETPSTTATNPSITTKTVFAQKQSSSSSIHRTYEHYINSAQANMNARISEYIESEKSSFDELRRRVERERDDVVSRTLRTSPVTITTDATTGCKTIIAQPIAAQQSQQMFFPDDERLAIGGDKINNGYTTLTGNNGVLPLTDIGSSAITSTQSVHSRLVANAEAIVPQPDNVRRWSDSNSASGGNDSAVPPSPQSLLSRPSPAADQMDDLSENMLFGDDEAEPTESRDDRQKQRRPRAQRVPRTGDSDGESDDSGTYQDIISAMPNLHNIRQRQNAGTIASRHSTDQRCTVGAGRLADTMGTSLPVTIRGAKYWPPKDAVDSHPASSSEDEDSDGFAKQPKNVCLPHRPKNTHEAMVELSRSIQAADDPERLFGERPNRRRYRTGEATRGTGNYSKAGGVAWAGPADMPSDLLFNEEA